MDATEDFHLKLSNIFSTMTDLIPKIVTLMKEPITNADSIPQPSVQEIEEEYTM